LGCSGGDLNTLKSFIAVEPLTRDDLRDRPAAVFGSDVTQHA
jgi:hypothetical protein